MMFSTDNESLLEELKPFLPFASTYNPERIISLLNDTERIFIVPVLGSKLHEKLYNEIDSYPDEVRMCRKSISNIMAYLNFTVLNTQIIPGGFARLSGDNVNQLYKYQEEELKRTFRRNGFDELDLIVHYFMKNVEKFPEFKQSEYYLSGRGEIIPDRFTFSKYYKNINHIVFKHLQPFILRAIDLDISPIIDTQKIKADILDKKEDTKLLVLLRPVIVSLAVAYAIEDMGVNINESGIWLESIIAGDGLVEKNNLQADQVESLVSKYRNLSARYMDEVQKYMTGSQEKINPYSRNNRDKKTFWA